MSDVAARVGCVILSRGDRPTELDRALRSVVAQRHVAVDVVVVGNGWTPKSLPDGVTGHALPTNLGVPAARNIGAGLVGGDVLLFLDDDASFPDDDVLAQVVAEFDASPDLAVIQPRALDPSGLPTARRHVPRLRGVGPTYAGDVAWFWEGCSFLRRSAFDAAGGWPGSFFYGHEGVEVAWRIIDAGARIRYEPSLTVCNPEAAPFRGEHHRVLDARNRVWVARRNLPLLLLPLYLVVWFALSLARARRPAELIATVRGFTLGFIEPAGERRPMSWRTAWRLTRLGRPPVI